MALHLWASPLQETMREAQKNLTDKAYVDIDKRFRTQKQRVQTTEMATRDLEK